MIITVSGKAGSGKSTIARTLAQKLHLKHYSSGDFMREMAKEKGMTLAELSKLAEQDNGAIDKEIDERQKKLGKTEDDFVIDGRLSAFFIPNAEFKIFLDVELDEGAGRIAKDKRATESAEDIKEMKEKIEKREASEVKRYKQYYGFDCYDKTNYDVLIDTTELTPEQVIGKIVKLVNK
ncbi:nucleoside monophosphate kinase [Candidatus Woesearchaeota archaeon]|nr:nucleoside monophosphate kinase [Candidatus Woesearchaeota archaeon]